MCAESRQGPLPEFCKLAALYAEQEDLVCISDLIKQSLAILLVTVATIETKLMTREATTKSSFEYPMLALQEAYLVCIRLVSVILEKMEDEERQKNAYAINL